MSEKNIQASHVQKSFNAQKFMSHIGAQLTKVEEGYCEITLPFDENLTQQNGFFHAGIISTLADNAAGYASYSMMDDSSSILTIELKINLLSPGIGDKLLAKGSVVKKGKNIVVARSDIFIIKDGVEKLCAISQSTLMELRK